MAFCCRRASSLCFGAPQRDDHAFRSLCIRAQRSIDTIVLIIETTLIAACLYFSIILVVINTVAIIVFFYHLCRQRRDDSRRLQQRVNMQRNLDLVHGNIPPVWFLKPITEESVKSIIVDDELAKHLALDYLQCMIELLAQLKMSYPAYTLMQRIATGLPVNFFFSILCDEMLSTAWRNIVPMDVLVFFLRMASNTSNRGIECALLGNGLLNSQINIEVFEALVVIHKLRYEQNYLQRIREMYQTDAVPTTPIRKLVIYETFDSVPIQDGLRRLNELHRLARLKFLNSAVDHAQLARVSDNKEQLGFLVHDYMLVLSNTLWVSLKMYERMAFVWTDDEVQSIVKDHSTLHIQQCLVSEFDSMVGIPCVLACSPNTIFAAGIVLSRFLSNDDIVKMILLSHFGVRVGADWSAQCS